MKMYYSAALSCVALLAWSLTSATGETIIVESRTTGGTTGGITPNPPYQEVQGNWSGSGSHTTAPGVTSGIGSRFASSTNIIPILRLAPPLQPYSTYRMSISHIAINASPNVVVDITYEGCTGTATSTTNFNSARANVWEATSDITTGDGTAPPAIIFTWASGPLAGTGGRWYSDAFKFQNDPCIFSTVPELVGVTGPLGEGQTFVNVPAVSADATAVSVYADGVLIGQKTSGVTAGLNRVETTALVKGQVITAAQSDSNGVEACRPAAGAIAGGGANPTVRLALSIRQDTSLTGPIGGNGGAGATVIKFLGASNILAGGAPVTSKAFTPSSAWQTIEFLRGEDPTNSVDPTVAWNNPDTLPNVLKGNFGVFDGLGVAVDGDSGPFVIYIDELRNGSTLIQSFEDANPGAQTVQFVQPSSSGTTSPFLLNSAANSVSPNVSVVTNSTANHGAHSLVVSWQFKDTNAVNWLRLPTSGASGTPNAMLDLRLPISMKMLILPAGAQVPPSAPVTPFGPADQRVLAGGNITLRINVKGTSPFTYQWYHNGVTIPNATNRTLTLTNVQLSQAGPYTVYIANALGYTVSPPGTLTVEDVPFTGVMTPAWRLPAGSRPYLTNDGATRSIAFNPTTGNLLLASRSANTNAIYALNGDTGELVRILEPPAGGIQGGTLALNQVAVVPEDGTIYACNLTTDGATNNFRIYRWFDEFDNAPVVLWEGNPANNPDIHLRWGDAVAVRDLGGGSHQVIVSSSGTLVAFIQPDFPAIVVADLGPAGVAAGDLRLGLAVAPNDIAWGKSSGSPLLQVQMDASLTYGTILNSFSGLGTMTAIGLNSTPNGPTLLGGIFVDTPDHFRLFDIATPGSVIAVDTEFFPTDNGNANATGGIAFGNNKIYALDSNNGLVAMNLNNLDCLPDKLTIERSGSDVILRWTRSVYRLEGTSTLGSGWTPIAGGSPKTVPATGMQFFRLVCP